MRVSGPAEHLDATRPLRLRHRAEPAELRRIRRSVGRWAWQNAVPDEVLVDLQLALGEAVANGVEHAYRGGAPGTVDVELEIRPGPGRSRVVAVRVLDNGRWRPTPVVDGYRGRGLALIEQLAERVEVLATGRGTLVCFEIPLL